jgi:formate hydrogenlyase subunit 6/NADH:ubiquinone oxidoreductase subunit I
MARIALRNLLSPAATRRYPAVTRPAFAGSRGGIAIDYPLCVHCLACQRHCPAGAIRVDREAQSWELDRFACVVCGACVRACPKKCLSLSVARPAYILVGSGSLATETHGRAREGQGAGPDA